MEFELKKIGLWSAVKISFLINALLALLIGLLIGFSLMLIMGFAQQMMPYDQTSWGGPDLMSLGMFGGFFIGILYAAFIVVVNVIVTAIAVLLYNLFAGWLGGIKFTMHEVPAVIEPSMTLAKTGEQPGSAPADA